MDVPTVGVEEEFFLVDRSGGLRTDAEEVLGRADGLEHELRTAMVETGSAICSDLDDVEEELCTRRTRLAAAAGEVGARVLATGTHPLDDPEPVPVTRDDRYQRMAEAFGATAYDTLVCGCHVHVAVPDRDAGVHVLDRIRPWAAVLLALSANSPFWRGEDTSYAAWRPQVWKRWPTAGPTEVFGSLATYEGLGRQLQDCGAALDEGMLYYDARLSRQYPTVEVRVADVCRLPEDAVLVAGLARALVMTALADDGPPPDVPVALLRAASWSASRHGTEGPLVDPVTRRAAPAADVLRRLVHHVTPPLEEAGDLLRVTDGILTVLARGSGAPAQRAALAAGGWDAVQDAVTVR
ncbi:MAG: glutamate---cysteine ligase / carboxylate-amine ligase [Frankiales bacterium]|nr:glutamate---cysteine ligase / carboxylate-amine ligase [Frankiales bacterium]